MATELKLKSLLLNSLRLQDHTNLLFMSTIFSAYFIIVASLCYYNVLPVQYNLCPFSNTKQSTAGTRIKASGD